MLLSVEMADMSDYHDLGPVHIDSFFSSIVNAPFGTENNPLFSKNQAGSRLQPDPAPFFNSFLASGSRLPATSPPSSRRIVCAIGVKRDKILLRIMSLKGGST